MRAEYLPSCDFSASRTLLFHNLGFAFTAILLFFPPLFLRCRVFRTSDRILSEYFALDRPWRVAVAFLRFVAFLSAFDSLLRTDFGKYLLPLPT